MVGWANNGKEFLHVVGDVLKWCLPIHHQIEDAAEGPHVRVPPNLVDLSFFVLSLQHLRSHVVEGTTAQILQHTGAVVLELVGDAKVNELKLRPHHEKVGWFEVTVHNALIMDGLYVHSWTVHACTDGSK